MDRKIDIKAIRAKLEITQAQLGEALGVDQSTVSNWERDGMPNGHAQKLLLQLFKDTLRDLESPAPFPAPGGAAESEALA